MRNQTSFRLTTTLLPSDTTAKTTTVINKLDAGGNKFYPTFTEETVVLTNDDRTIMETTKATCTNGVLTFVKRGLSDDLDPSTGNEYEIANRKLTWNPGSIAFVTAGASDILDKDDDIVWSGNQTFTGSATYQGALITRKGVKYPNFATLEDLEAYEGAFGGMFATVDSTGELYRYNAVTEQWDLVSTVEIGQYIIRVDDEPPSSGTSDTIVTLAPNLHSIYVGDDAVVDNHHLDILLVGGGGGGGGASSQDSAGGGGGGGGVDYKQAHKVVGTTFTVKVGAGGSGGNAVAGSDGGISSFGNLSVLGGGGGGVSFANGRTGNNGGGAGCTDNLSTATYGGVGYATSFNLGHNGADAVTETGYWHRYKSGQGGSSQFNGTATTALNSGSYFNIGGYTLYASEGGGGGEHGNYSASGGASSDSNYYCTQGTSSTAVGGGGGGAAKEWNSYSDRQMGQSTGGNGKDGVVIVAYPTDGSYGFTSATGGTVTTSTIGSKQYKVHTFTADGTFTIIS